MSTSRATFPGSSGAELAGRLHLPLGKARGWALFAHCFTCSKDLRAARVMAAVLVAAGELPSCKAVVTVGAPSDPGHAGGPNDLLDALITLDVIGLTIGTGLVCSCNRATLVPFDKQSTGCALLLRLIPDNFASHGNFDRCTRVTDPAAPDNPV